MSGMGKVLSTLTASAICYSQLGLLLSSACGGSVANSPTISDAGGAQDGSMQDGGASIDGPSANDTSTSPEGSATDSSAPPDSSASDDSGPVVDASQLDIWQPPDAPADAPPADSSSCEQNPGDGSLPYCVICADDNWHCGDITLPQCPPWNEGSATCATPNAECFTCNQTSGTQFLCYGSTWQDVSAWSCKP